MDMAKYLKLISQNEDLYPLFNTIDLLKVERHLKIKHKTPWEDRTKASCPAACFVMQAMGKTFTFKKRLLQYF